MSLFLHHLGRLLVLQVERVPPFLPDVHHFELEGALIHLYFLGRLPRKELVEPTHLLALLPDILGEGGIFEQAQLEFVGAFVLHLEEHMRGLVGGGDAEGIGVHGEALSTGLHLFMRVVAPPLIEMRQIDMHSPKWAGEAVRQGGGVV